MSFMRLPHRRPAFVVVFGVLVLSLAIASCATTRATRARVQPSGFLSDYSQLTPGGKGEPQQLYINPTTDFGRYDAIFIHSVTLWKDPQTENVSPQDQQILTDALYASLNEHLRKNFQIVDEPGPGVMELRAAITEARGSKVVLNTITSVVPPLRMLTTLGGLATGVAAVVGEAAIEVEITNSMDRHLLVAAVDQRVGTKAVRGGIMKWSDVKEAFDYWARKIDERLVALHRR